MPPVEPCEVRPLRYHGKSGEERDRTPKTIEFRPCLEWNEIPMDTNTGITEAVTSAKFSDLILPAYFRRRTICVEKRERKP